MSFHLSPIGNDQQFDANGDPLNGGKIYTYLAGTTTPVATYTDDTGVTPQANPIILNSLGAPASPIWLTGGVTYKFVIKDANDVTLRTIDDISGINDFTSNAADEWTLYGSSPTYTSATSFTLVGDQTLIFQVNRRLKSANTGGTIYSSILTSVYSAPNTTVTVVNDSGSLDAGMSAVSYALLNATNPSVPYQYAKKAEIQAQTYTAFTTAGTATAFTLTPTPAISAYAENQEFDVKFHTASSGTPTLNISAVAAKSLKYRDSTGTLVSVGALIPSGWRSKVVYDGTDLIVREMPPAEPAIAAYAAPVRQTVLSGPVDSNGLPNFGGSTGSTTVTMTGTLVATAANGAASTGAVDLAGSITNASWTGLSTNGTMYLYLTVNADGTCTTGSTTLRPNYQAAGTYSTTSGQSTFNVQEMTMKMGNGSSADQAYRVFVGEVTVSGGVVSTITWYALMGRYIGPWTATLPGTNTEVSASHNLGVGGSTGATYVGAGVTARFELRSDSTDAGYSAGDQIDGALCQPSAGNYARVTPRLQRLTAYVRTGANIAFVVTNASNGALAYTGSGLSSANWSYRFVVERTW